MLILKISSARCCECIDSVQVRVRQRSGYEIRLR